MKQVFILLIIFLVTLTGCSSKVKKESDTSTTEVLEPTTNATEVEAATTEADVSTTPKDQEYFIKVTGNRPFAVAFAENEVMYMVTAPSIGSGTLSKVMPDGTVSELAKIAGNFIGPGMTVDKDNNVYIAAGDKLYKFTPEGESMVISEGFSRCIDVKLDTEGNLFVVDDLKDTLYKITPSGDKSVYYEGGLTGGFVLTSLVFDKDCKHLYVREGDHIISFDMSIAAEEVVPVVVATESDMFYICIDDEDHLFVTLPSKNLVKYIKEDGTTTDVNNTYLLNPIGLAQGGAGFDESYLYIAVANGIVKQSK